ncbi:hypothetical protein GCM10022232_17880 [Streptomyces plumbiresistens]|uniref:Uncharacterized protein n=1 Tax=Streptomyces plumbiresistens TaxID=511811 RepID=A0ABP7QNE1_9ACTN
MPLVEELSRPQAAVKLADHVVEGVSLGLGVPVFALAPSAVDFWSGGDNQGGEGPEDPGGDQPIVPDEAAPDVALLARGPGDGGRARVGLQCAGVREACAVVSSLGWCRGTEMHSQAGEAEEELSVRVPAKVFLHRRCEIFSGRADGIQLPDQCEQLVSLGVLDGLWPVGVAAVEDNPRRPVSASMPRMRHALPPSCAELSGSGRSEEVALRWAHTAMIYVREPELGPS